MPAQTQLKDVEGLRMLKLEWPAHAWALLQCDALGHVRPVSEPDRQAKADVYALSMGRRVAGKAAWRGRVSVQFNDL